MRPGVPGGGCGTGVAAAPDFGAPGGSTDRPDPRPQPPPGGAPAGCSPPTPPPAPLQPDTPRRPPRWISSLLSGVSPSTPRPAPGGPASRPGGAVLGGTPALNPRPSDPGTQRLSPGRRWTTTTPTPRVPAQAVSPALRPSPASRGSTLPGVSASFPRGEHTIPKEAKGPSPGTSAAHGLGPCLGRTRLRSAAAPRPRQALLGLC